MVRERSDAPAFARGPEKATGSPFARFRQTRHFGSLDGLRALSILAVVWHHCTPRPLPGLLGKGPFGVSMFFAVSGFLITTLLLRERSARGTVHLRAFYARRSLRIFPLYYVVLAATVAFMFGCFPAGPQREHFFRNLPHYACYTSNWFVDFSVPHPVTFAFAWSLATEEQFYLTWPWVLKYARGLALPALAMALLLLVDQGAELGFIPALPRGSALLRIARSLSAPIVLGALGALLAHGRLGFAALQRLLGGRYAPPFLLLALGASLAAQATPDLVVHATMAALVTACCLREDHGLGPLLRWRPLAGLGRVSYGVYLLHAPAIGLGKVLLPDWPHHAILLWVLATALSTAAASLSYRFFEGPLLRYKHRFAAIPASRVGP